MTKFILVLQLCFVGADCYPPISNKELVLDKWKSCAIAGYEQSIIIMNGLDKIEQDRPLVRFWCSEQHEKKTDI